MMYIAWASGSGKSTLTHLLQTRMLELGLGSGLLSMVHDFDECPDGLNLKPILIALIGMSFFYSIFIYINSLMAKKSKSGVDVDFVHDNGLVPEHDASNACVDEIMPSLDFKKK